MLRLAGSRALLFVALGAVASAQAQGPVEASVQGLELLSKAGSGRQAVFCAPTGMPVAKVFGDGRMRWSDGTQARLVLKDTETVTRVALLAQAQQVWASVEVADTKAEKPFTRLCRFELATKVPLWCAQMLASQVVSARVKRDGDLLAAGSGQLARLDGKTGRFRWKTADLGTNTAPLQAFRLPVEKNQEAWFHGSAKADVGPFTRWGLDRTRGTMRSTSVVTAEGLPPAQVQSKAACSL